MNRLEADVAVLGAGFGGSLTALILARIGLRVVLIERGRHPRFALGESSTPIADFVLARLAQRYDLPRLLPLCKYGTWKKTYPDIACGCKRGFSYFQHERGKPFTPRADHANELLVAASPSRELADTQWYRADVDHFFVREAIAVGVVYLDETEITDIDVGKGWALTGSRQASPVEVWSSFLVDATGNGQLVASTFGLSDQSEHMRTNTRSVYGHFHHVAPFKVAYERQGGVAGHHPFPCDAAAQHHILDHGWLWMLRFDNGVTSAGLVFDRQREAGDWERRSAASQWRDATTAYPSVAAMFADAEATRPLSSTGRLQRRWSRFAGENWAMLPSAAYALDPLHSTGIAHNLLGVERLVAILAAHVGGDCLPDAIARNEDSLRREIELLDQLVHGCYATMADFPRFVDYSMLYFLAATYSEHRYRSSGIDSNDLFLLAGDGRFIEIVDHFYVTATQRGADNTRDATQSDWGPELAEALTCYNVAGLCDPSKMNMYPFLAVEPPQG